MTGWDMKRTNRAEVRPVTILMGFTAGASQSWRAGAGYLVTAGALDIHEVAVRVPHEALQLVLALLVLWAGMQKVFCEGHLDASVGT